MPIQRWRSPVAGRVKGVIVGGLCAAVAIVFFQPWFGITLAAVIGLACIANLLLGAEVTLDTETGVLGLRWGLVIRRVRLADVTAVLVEDSKLSIGRAGGGEISIYLWGRGKLDRWLGLPVVAGDIGHAIAKASNAARSAAEAHAADAGVPAAVGAAADAAVGMEAPAVATAPGVEAGGDSAASAGTASSAAAASSAGAAVTGRRGSSAASRSALATVLLGCLGLLAVGAALLVRHSWDNPVMSVLAVILALVLGIGGVFYVCLSAALFANSARLSRQRKPAG